MVGAIAVDGQFGADADGRTVTHPIVSQVNPHVHLFFFAPQGSAGKPVAHRKNKGRYRYHLRRC